MKLRLAKGSPCNRAFHAVLDDLMEMQYLATPSEKSKYTMGTRGNLVKKQKPKK